MKNMAIANAVLAVGAAGHLCADPEFAVGDRAEGFVVRSVADLPDVEGRLVRMEYEKNGADLVWLDRDDGNKTFAIGFRTLPGDDTGVAHIIEHSVLCGSAKYPVKEPFGELRKSSFATYLNAWTDADSTMYPVSSRNQQDLLNLVDVYMDAVFHPLCVRSPLAFRQEGWRYELDGPDGELGRNGVVLSEMRGAYSDPERILRREVARLLLPDTAYAFESGGDPSAIPSLTFERFKAFYERFYHPSNARIFLDGRMDVRAVLAKLDGFLAPYGRREVDAPVQFQRPVSADRTVEYAIGADERPEGKVFVATGWVCGRFDEHERNLALDVLADVLAGDNESPLKKALVEAGLCEDVAFGVSSYAQTRAVLYAKGVKAENVEAVRRTVRDTLSGLADGGLDRSRIAAVLNRAEFRLKEMDTGSLPRGLAYYRAASSLWEYGGDPADAFRYGWMFASLRAKAASGWFEALLRECFVDNVHVAKLTMVPSTTLAAERRAAEKGELAAIKAGWSREELEGVLAECAALGKRQAEPDRPEDIAKLPHLSVADVPEEGPFVPREIARVGEVAVIRPRVHANGLLYVECHFSAEGFSSDELADLPALARVLAELRTARHSLEELRNTRDGKLGRCGMGVDAHSSPDGGAPRPYFHVKAASLASCSEDVLSFVPEVLRETVFDDVKAIGSLLRQKRLSMERSANGINGCTFAVRRACAQLTSRGAMQELFDGIAQIRRLQEVEARFAERGRAYADRLAALAARLFTRERMVVCLSGDIPLEWAARLAEAFPCGESAEARETRPFPRMKEGFRTLGSISGTAMASHPARNPHSGVAVVAARILSLEYLWHEIRVKGGAYGGGLTISPGGDVRWMSWNDPNPARSLGVYAGCGDALRAFADGNDPLDRHIVSAVAYTEPYITPRAEVSQAASLWLSGRTPEDQQRTRSEMLKATKADLRAFAAEVDSFAADAAVCVVGGPQPLEACTNALDRVETLAR